MKLAIVLCIFGALFLVCHTSPVPAPAAEKTSKIVTPLDNKKDVVKESGRQATNDIAPSPDDDDDDEDDDDDDDEEDVIGGVLDDDEDDDDDDDDDEEEDDSPQGQAAPSSDDEDDDDDDADDDDDDDLESLFEDIAGDVDDDDDDEDDEDEVTNQVVSQAVVPAAAAAVVPAGPEVVPDASAIDTKVDVQSLNEDTGVPSASIGSAEKGHGAGLGVGHHHHHSHLVSFGNHHKGSGSSSSSGSEEADDDIVVEDYMDTERSFKRFDEETVSQKDIIFQDKHNAFIDAIFARINKMLSDSFDPLNVQLSGRSNHFKGKSNNGKQQRNNNKSKKSKGRNQITSGFTATELDSTANTIAEEKQNSVDTVDTVDTVGELRANQVTSSASVPLKKSTYSGNVAGFNSNDITSSKKPGKSNSKTKQSGLNSSNREQLEKAEATLYGLASLKRIGNVKMITDPEGKNSTIKTKFTLGPLKLKVEKSFKRGSVRSVKSAAAVTNEMVGRMKFRVWDNSATLVSIKVQQPKQVEVESKDNHDRTRKFVWEKTPQLANLVSENLKIAIEHSVVPQTPQVIRL